MQRTARPGNNATNEAASHTAAAGSYLLVIGITSDLTIEVGRLGRVALPAGRYAYCGSAFGPGGVGARVARHLRHDKARHWHIDYLTMAAPVTVTITRSGDRLECAWSQALAQLPGASVPAVGFGASDCRHGCRSHLVRLPDALSLDRLEGLLCQTSI